ncbi:MAG TPA: hypothetical protein VMP01_16190 [Pirellulaceae bacterium]|nr:hypothetical protein [Pirellulaceae bacterium]
MQFRLRTLLLAVGVLGVVFGSVRTIVVIWNSAGDDIFGGLGPWMIAILFAACGAVVGWAKAKIDGALIGISAAFLVWAACMLAARTMIVVPGPGMFE